MASRSQVVDKEYKDIQSSALKPKKLTFGNNSPSRQFSLLDSDKKEPDYFENETALDPPVGRFSLALHACMTPRNNNDASMVESEEEDDYGVEEEGK